MKLREIAAIIKSIAESGLPVDEYLQKHSVPFSRAQYFRYKARLEEHGVDGLSDGRRTGNHRKLTREAEGFLRGTRRADPQKSARELQQMVESALEVRVVPTTIS